MFTISLNRCGFDSAFDGGGGHSSKNRYIDLLSKAGDITDLRRWLDKLKAIG
jgi:hypothetical protein